MLEDQILVSLLSFGICLGASIGVGWPVLKRIPGRSFARVGWAAGLASIGVFVTVFVASGFGWGWYTPEGERLYLPLILGGLGVGCAHALFAGLVTKRAFLGSICLLLAANLVIAFLPGPPTPRALVFAIANVLLLRRWLVKAMRPDGGGGHTALDSG